MRGLPCPFQKGEPTLGGFFLKGKEMGIRGRKKSEGFAYEAEIAY